MTVYFELFLPLACLPTSCYHLSIWKSSFPFLPSICALSNSFFSFVFCSCQAAWWSFTERWFTRVNTTSRTSPGRSTPSTCLIKRTPPTASRTGGYSLRHMQSHVNLIGLGGHGHFWTIQISLRRRVLCKDIGKHTNFKSSVLR